MLPPFPSNTKEQIRQMIDYDGRQVTFYVVESVSGCYLCDLDPISQTSTDSYCPICSGQYWIETYSGWDVTAHVTWGKHDSKQWETGGMIDNGDCTVKFIFSGWMQDIIDDTKYVIVDDREMNIVNVILRGVPEINRVLVNLKEKEA